MEPTLEFIIENRSALLQELNQRQGILRDYVRAVATQYATGAYLFGRAGTAKTHTTRTVLDETGEPYVYQRGHLTPMGLFELLGAHPGDVIVLDDLGAVLSSPVALQILLAALEHPAPDDRSRTRLVGYRRQGRIEKVAFTGGLICISNKTLHDDELIDAFRSRVNVLNYAPSDPQLGAVMLDLASRGWPPGGQTSISATDATTVARYLISELLRCGCPFDLRLFVNKALPHFQQWKDEEAESEWRDLVTASIEEQLTAVRHADEAGLSREERLQAARELVRTIQREHSNRADRLRAWRERSGQSERAYYRRQAELADE